MGRKRKDTPENVDAICKALSGGSTIRDACAYAGVSQASYERWSKDNADFAERIKRAQANARIESIARIRKAGGAGNWQADAWFLERTDPEHFSRRDKHTVQIEGLDELLKLAQLKGINASDLFNSLIAELADADTRTENS